MHGIWPDPVIQNCDGIAHACLSIWVLKTQWRGHTQYLHVSEKRDDFRLIDHRTRLAPRNLEDMFGIFPYQQLDREIWGGNYDG